MYVCQNSPNITEIEAANAVGKIVSFISVTFIKLVITIVATGMF